MSDADIPLLMLVDDEPAQRRLNMALASRAGWRTIWAQNAEDALSLLDTRDGLRLSAVIVDDWTPGLEATTLIRAIHDKRPNLPVLVLTANGSAALAVEAMRAGAFDFLIKPIAPESFLAALQSVLSSPSEQGELRPAHREDSRAARLRRDHRLLADLPRRSGHRRQGRTRPGADPHRRRKRRRQGSAGPCHSRHLAARAPADGHGQLRRDPAQSGRKRPVRP